jgi:hypothetical protein
VGLKGASSLEEGGRRKHRREGVLRLTEERSEFTDSSELGAFVVVAVDFDLERDPIAIENPNVEFSRPPEHDND